MEQKEAKVYDPRDPTQIENVASAEPVAWIFELASMFNKSTGEYSGWREMIQVSKPHVPPGSIRNLRPLYAGQPVELSDG